MNKLRKDAKAISPLVATLLLIAIAVAASVITYSWVMSMIGAQSQQAQTQVRIDVVEFKNSSTLLDQMVLTIRNTGSVAATIESVSVTNEGTTVTATLESQISINVGETNTYTIAANKDGIPSDWLWELSKSYTIRVTCTTGFYYEAFAASPSTAPTA